MKRNIEETGEKFFTISPKKVFVDSDASKGSQDEGTNKANKPGLTTRQPLLARLASEPIKSRELQMLQRDWLLVCRNAVLKIAYS